MTATNDVTNVVSLFSKTPYQSPAIHQPARDDTPINRSRFTPRAASAIHLPEHSPTPDEIQHQRQVVAFIDYQKAADLCGVSVRTWRRWEDGGSPMPRAMWGWFQAMSTVGVSAGGPDWHGWRFYQGELWSPEGVCYTHGQLRSIPYVYAQLREAKRQAAEIKEKHDWLQDEVQIVKRDYAHVMALGQMDSIIAVMMQMMLEYRVSEDDLVRSIAEDIWNLGVQACSIKLKLLKGDSRPTPPTGRPQDVPMFGTDLVAATELRDRYDKN